MTGLTNSWYGYSYRLAYEYKSSITIGGWPLVHVCGGVDPQTLRPRIAKGVIAIGDIAVGVLAIGGVACGLSVGGFAVGTIAIGGVAIGVSYAVGGVALAPGILKEWL